MKNSRAETCEWECEFVRRCRRRDCMNERIAGGTLLAKISRVSVVCRLMGRIKHACGACVCTLYDMIV